MLRRIPWWVWAGTVLVVIVVVAGWFFLARYRPPSEFVFATGREGGAYYAFAEEYQQRLADKGYKMSLLPTAGSVDILEALNTGKADVGFVQGGTVQSTDTSNLVSLGTV